MTGYWHVERLQRDGTWKQITPEGMGAFQWNRAFFVDKRDAMKRGTIRISGTDGTIDREHTA